MIEYEGNGVNEIIISITSGRCYLEHPLEKTANNGVQVDHNGVCVPYCATIQLEGDKNKPYVVCPS